MNLSGLANPDEATKVGHLTGAKLLVTGSVIEVDKSLYLVAKIIGTETTRVVGASVKGQDHRRTGQARRGPGQANRDRHRQASGPT